MSGHKHTSGDEHDFEPEHGLPERLPANEHLLWQGSPDWRTLAVKTFHLRKLAAYFGLILAARGVTVSSQGGTVGESLVAMLWLLPAAALALGLIALFAWLCARTTVYTITDRRVVMRIGIVLSVTFNLPLRSITAAGLRDHRDGTGDIPITLVADSKIAFVHLWPHARPWRLAHPEPMMCSVPDVAAVAQTLAAAWSAATGIAPQRAARSPTPALANERPGAASRGAPNMAASH